MSSGLRALQNQLNTFNPVSNAQKEIKAVLEVYFNAEPQRPNQACIEDLKQDLTVELLYCEENIKGPILLFRLLRDYLVLKGLRYQEDPENRRIMYGLIESFLDSDTDKAYARQRLASKNSNTTAASATDVPYTRMPEHHDDRKIAHNMAVRFKKDDKFSGKIGEDVNEYIFNYKEAAIDYELSTDQMLKYFHNLFDGEAKSFYRHHVQTYCTSFEEASTKIQLEFNSIARQNRVRKYLQSLSLTSIMEEKSCSVAEGLEKLREVITKFTPQGPRTHRSEEDKVEYLYDAVIGAEWAQPALTQCYATTPPWNFQQLYTALDSVWLQKQKVDEKRGYKNDTSRNISTQSSILWEKQGFYGIPRNRNSSSSTPRPFNRHAKHPHHFKKPRCYNCNSPNHLMKDCKRSPNLMKNVNALLKDNPRSAKTILFELCQQWEDDFTESADDESAENDATESTDQESEEHLEENVVEHLHQNIDSDYNEMYF